MQCKAEFLPDVKIKCKQHKVYKCSSNKLMLVTVFQDSFVMQVIHLLMLYGFGTVVWHDLIVCVEEGLSIERGTLKPSQMSESYSIFNADLNM